MGGDGGYNLDNMKEYLINDRICPQPMKWNELYSLLKDEVGKNKLSPPLLLAGWNFSNDYQKKDRFQQHLQLIKEENLTAAMAFLEELNEKEWYHNEE